MIVALALFGIIGGALFLSGTVPLWAGVGITLLPVAGFIISRLYYVWMGFRVLNGKHGEERRWVAEFIRDNDSEFMQALEENDKMDMNEVMVLADSKEELRELVIKRSNEDE